MSDPGLTLREYQTAGKDFLLGDRRILGDDPGLGKTPPAILAARELVPDRDILVIAPKVAHGVWRREVRKWVGEDVMLYTGQPGVRAAIDLGYGKAWYVCNYQMAAEVFKRRRWWPLIILDESHHVRNRNASLYKNAKLGQCDHMFELTGSPLVNGLWDLWAQLNVMHPKTFTSYWRYVYEHCMVERGKFGMEIGGPKNPSHTKVVLEPYLLRRTKKSSGLNLPPKQRGVIEVEHTPQQRKLYTALCKDMVASLGDGSVIMTPSRMALVTRLRQTNITPALYGGPHSSGAFDAMGAKLEELFDAQENVIVFTPFTEAIPYLIETGKKHTDNMAVIQGGMSGGQIDEVVEWFQDSGKPRRLLFASIRMGTSWTATAASNCIFMGYDWTPMYNGQCEDRLHRFGQTSMVNAWYMIARGTVDENVLDVLDKKTSWNNLILNPAQLLRPKPV
jgi:SNF2 family DNA or RNA helicase